MCVYMYALRCELNIPYIGAKQHLKEIALTENKIDTEYVPTLSKLFILTTLIELSHTHTHTHISVTAPTKCFLRPDG